MKKRQPFRRVVADIADYVHSGMEVVEIVGVAASPSCGVTTTLNLSRALRAMAECDPATIDRAAGMTGHLNVTCQAGGGTLKANVVFERCPD